MMYIYLTNNQYIHMNFSSEEIYFDFGQYDTFVTLQFDRNSDEFKKFGSELMGVFNYILAEREDFEKLRGTKSIPRTDLKIKFVPSELETISEEDMAFLNKEGIHASSIKLISFFDRKRENRFTVTEKKNIENQIQIKAPSFSGWEDLNRVRFGFLNSLYRKGTRLTPRQKAEYWAFRKHLSIGLEEEDYKRFLKISDQSFKDEVRLIELETKLQELTMTEPEVTEFVKLSVDKRLNKKRIIDLEIQKSHEKIKEIADYYETQLDELKKACYKFDEDIIAFGDMPIYLSFDRFVHIYARHTSETQIGDRFSGKTVFQYKYEDILYVLKMVVDHERQNIQEFFRQNTGKPFLRMASKAIYVDGTYYRLQIEQDGSITDFHPYNNNEEKETDSQF